MDFKTLTPQISVTRQITAQDVADATVQGYGAILSNRPDGEEPGQPSAADIAELADRHGMAFEHVPVVSGAITDADVAKMRIALSRLRSPILAFCRTGTRSATLWALAQAGVIEPREILSATANAGYNLEILLPRLTRASASGATAGCCHLSTGTACSRAASGWHSRAARQDLTRVTPRDARTAPVCARRRQRSGDLHALAERARFDRLADK
jgi:uncharacterized protein (TIGR01244 family)